MSLQERIATLALSTFAALPPRCKPRTQADGRQEWTPMAAVVIALSSSSSPDVDLKCVSLATGTKCLPATSIPKCAGLVIHDSHAETLALRGLNLWLLHEMRISLLHPDHMSQVIEARKRLVLSMNEAATKAEVDPHRHRERDQHQDWEEPQSHGRAGVKPFSIRAGVAIYLFCSTAPCGDASMELLIGAKEDATPWDVGARHAIHPGSDHNNGSDAVVNTANVRGITAAADVAGSVGSESQIPLGRGYFSILGAMRRKPARGDAEVTMSKSCTDKLALKQFTGVLRFPLDLLLDDIACAAGDGHTKGSGRFLTALVVYGNQYNETGYNRAFSRDGRLASLTNQLEKSKFFDILVLPNDFPRFAYEKKEDAGGRSGKVTNISAVYVASTEGMASVCEVLVNGVKQGYRQFEDRAGKGSVLCRRKMVEAAVEIWILLEEEGFPIPKLQGMRYSDLKSGLGREQGCKDKEYAVKILGGWMSNSADDDFEVCMDGTRIM